MTSIFQSNDFLKMANSQFPTEKGESFSHQEEQRLRRRCGELRPQHHQGHGPPHHRQGERSRTGKDQSRWKTSRGEENLQQRE